MPGLVVREIRHNMNVLAGKQFPKVGRAKATQSFLGINAK
jgi:hypothetical protein